MTIKNVIIEFSYHSRLREHSNPLLSSNSMGVVACVTVMEETAAGVDNYITSHTEVPTPSVERDTFCGEQTLGGVMHCEIDLDVARDEEAGGTATSHHSKHGRRPFIA